MKVDVKLLFGGLIAVLLLGLYAYAVWFAISVVDCVTTAGCSRPTAADFTSGFATAMTTIGGLVAALVIAELAITPPGNLPAARVLGAAPSARAETILKIVTGIYLLVWVAAGLAAYIVGEMRHPGQLQPLTDLGQAWLGLAVAAAYTYFGINPSTNTTLSNQTRGTRGG
jgi:hypothetical protein